MFAVIDTETTGLSPNDDRIIELAVIGVNLKGDTEWEWCSLINPERDTGHGLAIRTHHIYPEDVQHAPTFDAFAGEIARMLTGRAIIAHNALFDLGMMAAEFGRLGYRLPELVRICTAQIAKEAGFRPYRLDACCETLCIEMEGMHHALADARATVHLARKLIDFSDPSLRSDVESRLLSCSSWPELPVAVVDPVTRRIMPVRKPIVTPGVDEDQAMEAARRVSSEETRPVVESFSIDQDSAESRYMAAVEWVLEDREIPEEQQAALYKLRTELNLSAEQVYQIHMTFIRGLAGSMWRDGAISNHEQFDLDIVGELLKLSAGDVENARDNPIGLELVNEHYILQPRDTVVFTGEMSIPRSEWKARAKNAGLRVTGSVSKKTNYLVVPFGKTGSGKSRKARELGIRVVSEQRFRRMMIRLEGLF